MKPIIGTIEEIKKQSDNINPKIILKLCKFKQIRSKQQNKFYWGVIIDILGNELGYQPLEMHEIVKVTFQIETTTELEKDEFNDMMEKIEIWANTEFNIVLPRPNEHELFKYTG